MNEPRMTKAGRAAAALVGGVLLTMAAVPAAGAAALPNPLVWTAYDVGSNGYSQAIAIGAAFKNEAGLTLRVLPGKNDVSRQIPLRENKAHFSCSGIGAYYSQEGAFNFGERTWGPQEIRILSLNHADTGTVLITAKDAGIKTLADLKGKRVAWVAGAPALNMSILAHLRFANLTWDDVQKIEFGGYAASQDALLGNQVDAAYVNTSAAGAYRLETSPRGLHYPPIPHNDDAGWKRLNEVLPYYQRRSFTKGALVSPEKPLEAGGGPYPLMIAYKSQKDDVAYEMTKIMYDLFPKYKDAAPGAEGWAMDRQALAWVAPYHEGAIRYYKEVGAWKPEHQKNNDEMVARQETLAKLWKEHLARNISDDREFEREWMKARAEGLRKAGLAVPFESW